MKKELTSYQPQLLNTIRAHGWTAQDKLSGLLSSGVSEVLEIIQAVELINVTEIENACEDMNQAQVSQHLAKLRRAGLVERNSVSKFKYYNIVPGSIERINRICAGLCEGYCPELVDIEMAEC